PQGHAEAPGDRGRHERGACRGMSRDSTERRSERADRRMPMKKTGTTIQGIWKATAIAGVLLAFAGSLTGCRGERSKERPRQFLPDMDDSPKWKAQVKSEFFKDNRTMRPKVAGTVAFGDTERLDDHSRERYAK